jgi:hypothetical protein
MAPHRGGGEVGQAVSIQADSHRASPQFEVGLTTEFLDEGGVVGHASEKTPPRLLQFYQLRNRPTGTVNFFLKETPL